MSVNARILLTILAVFTFVGAIIALGLWTHSSRATVDCREGYVRQDVRTRHGGNRTEACIPGYYVETK